jgi:opacity protein-like surface antigen
MKPQSRAVFAIVGAVCAAIFLAPSPAPGAEQDFFQKFNPTEPINWSGPYVGFNTGGSFNNFHIGHHMTDVDVTDQFYDLGIAFGNRPDTFATFDTPGHHKNDTETIGGGQTGFRLQFGHIVIGAEGSFIGNDSTQDARFNDFQTNQLFSAGGAVGEVPVQIGGVTADTVFQSMQKVETTWNGFAGGNIGFAWNRFLIYGEGGAAFTDVHFKNTDKADTSFFSNECVGDCTLAIPTGVAPRIQRAPGLNPPLSFIGEIVNKKTHTQGNVLTGWYGGGGVDFALTKIVTVGMEYKHVDWGDMGVHLMTGVNGGPVFPGNGHVGLDADQVSLKVNILVGPIGH